VSNPIFFRVGNPIFFHVGEADSFSSWFSFSGSDLGLPDFMLSMVYNPGDLCLFRSAIIEHAVAPFTGDRTAIVLFTHQLDLTLGKPDPKRVRKGQGQGSTEAGGTCSTAGK
jgi:hypothetical protein